MIHARAAAGARGKSGPRPRAETQRPGPALPAQACSKRARSAITFLRLPGRTEAAAATTAIRIHYDRAAIRCIDRAAGQYGRHQGKTQQDFHKCSGK